MSGGPQSKASVSTVSPTFTSLELSPTCPFARRDETRRANLMQIVITMIFFSFATCPSLSLNCITSNRQTSVWWFDCKSAQNTPTLGVSGEMRRPVFVNRATAAGSAGADLEAASSEFTSHFLEVDKDDIDVMHEDETNRTHESERVASLSSSSGGSGDADEPDAVPPSHEHSSKHDHAAHDHDHSSAHAAATTGTAPLSCKTNPVLVALSVSLSLSLSISCLFRAVRH